MYGMRLYKGNKLKVPNKYISSVLMRINTTVHEGHVQIFASFMNCCTHLIAEVDHQLKDNVIWHRSTDCGFCQPQAEWLEVRL